MKDLNWPSPLLPQLPITGYEYRCPVTLLCSAATTLRADSSAPAIQAFSQVME